MAGAQAFNTLGAEQLAAPPEGASRLTMLCAGPAERRGTLELLVAAAGLEPRYVGPIRYARNLEVRRRCTFIFIYCAAESSACPAHLPTSPPRRSAR